MTDQPNETVNAEAQDAPADTQDAQQTFDAAYVQKLRQEAASYRTKLREQEEAAKAAREDALKKASLEEQLTEREKQLQELTERATAAEAARVAAERRAALKGAVVDEDAALRLLDEEKHLNDDGSVNVEALLRDRPFLAAPTTPGARAVNSANAPASSKDRTLTPDELRGKTPQWINENWELVQRSLSKK